MFLGKLSPAALQHRLRCTRGSGQLPQLGPHVPDTRTRIGLQQLQSTGHWSNLGVVLPHSCSKEGCACFFHLVDKTKPSCDGDLGSWAWKVSECCKAVGEAAVNTHSSSRHWKSVDISKQWDMIIQKCELQEGVLPGLKRSRNLVVSGLKDPEEMFISVTKLAFMCPGFGRTLEEICPGGRAACQEDGMLGCAYMAFLCQDKDVETDSL